MDTSLNTKAAELNFRDEDLPTLEELSSTSQLVDYEFIAKEFGPAVAIFLKGLERVAVKLELDKAEVINPAGTYLGGHPFVAHDEDFLWPTGEKTGKPMVFLMQVNFAEIPALEGFPKAGLLQWWIDGADDVFGLEFEPDSDGKSGLLLKWYPEDSLSRAKSTPQDSIPNGDGDEDLGPLYHRTPFSLRPSLFASFPGWEDTTVDSEKLQLLGELRELLEDQAVSGVSGLPEILGSETQVGGYPSFIQSDPREGRENPGELVLQLESMGDRADVIMWGDVGNAQLFGDPRELARGELSSFWWDWACS